MVVEDVALVKSICSCILEQPCLRSDLSGMGSLVFTRVPCDTYLFDLSVTSPGLTVSHYADRMDKNDG